MAVIVSDKKWATLSARHMFDSRGPVRYSRVTSLTDLERVSPDLVLAKISDSPAWRGELSGYDGAAQVASVESQLVVHDRWQTYEGLKNRVKLPETRYVESEEEIEFNGKVILKTSRACGHPQSHLMLITESGDKAVEFYNSLKEPIIIQKFVPHDRFFLKVFVIGDQVFAFRRDSVNSNITESFSSQHIGKARKDQVIPIVDPELMSHIREISRICVETLEFSLMGLDFIQESESQELYLVDVNYFPTFSELGAQVGPLLDEFCHQFVVRNRGI